jgi:NitT/TauT family transport system ATP-binding protein
MNRAEVATPPVDREASPGVIAGGAKQASVLEVRGLTKTYGAGTPSQTVAIESVSFSVARGERVSIVGPSGCGKTTLLQCISGLQRPSGGQVSFKGSDVTAPPKGLAVVFQDYARSLFPWMSVENNVRLPLRYRDLTRTKQDELVRDALLRVGLASFANHYPSQLSGGMQQRVAIARALAFQPQLLLVDEPFASVDAQSRLDLEDLTLQLCRNFAITLILVTHDIDEAIYMGDKLVVLSPSPATVRELVAVDLPSERDQISTKSLRRFAEIRSRVYAMVTRRQVDG